MLRHTRYDIADIKVLKILDITRKLAAPIALLDMLRDVVGAGCDILDADRGNVLLYDDDRQQLFSTNPDDPFRFSVNVGISGDAARHRRTNYVETCQADERFYPGVDAKTGYHTRTLLAVPLFGLEEELVGVMTLLNPRAGRWDFSSIQLAEVLASQAAVAIQRAMVLEERERRQQMELELSIAQQMIEHIIPRQMPQLHEYDLAAWSRPVVQTGGDIYDLAPISCDSTEHLLLLADATGHGIGPAVSIAQFRAMVRLALRFDVSMTHMVEHINARLSEDLLDGRFITAFLGRLDPTSHTIEYHAMGHGPLLLYESEHRAFRLLASTSFPLGVLPVDQNARSSSLILQPGDCLVVLSDGFHEAGQSDGEQFGIERIQSLLKESANTPAHAMIQTLVDAVDQFTDGNQVDDMTALVVKRHPSSHHHHAKGV